MNPSPLGILDSGVGGLSVMREIVKKLPHEDLIYFADTAHCPYGSRSLEEIRALVTAIVTFLSETGCKAIVVSCNTASAAALNHLRRLFSLPIVGMEPAIKPAVEGTKSQVIGVIATKATFQGELFASLMERFAQGVTVLTGICPGLVEKVEAGLLDDMETEVILRGCLEPMVEAGMDSLVLGCTHYPFLKPLMEEIVGPSIRIIDPGPAVANQTARVLEREGLLKGEGNPGSYLFYTSGDPRAFATLKERLVDLPGEVKKASWSQKRLFIP